MKALVDHLVRFIILEKSNDCALKKINRIFFVKTFSDFCKAFRSDIVKIHNTGEAIVS